MRCLLAGALAGVAVFGSASAAPPWPIEKDIPRPGPVVLGLAGGPPDIARYLMVQGASGSLGAESFDLSPDGRQLLFLSSVSGEPQVWTVPVAGGGAIQLTFGSGVDQARWLPDGAGLLYEADSGGDEKARYLALSPDGRRERELLPATGAYRAFGSFSSDGQYAYASTERNGRDFDIYVANLKGGAPKRVFDGRYDFRPQGWQPRGPHVVVGETRGEDGKDLHLLNVETGKLETLYRPATPAGFDQATWTSDGAGFFVISNLDREFRNLAYHDLKTRKLAWIDEGPGEVTDVSLSRDDRYLAWVTEADGYSRIHVLDRRTNRRLPAPKLPAGVYQINMAADAPVLGIGTKGAQSNGDVYVWNLATGTLDNPVKTSWAGLDPAQMSTPQVITFPARDRTRLQGLLYTPRAAVTGGRKPPLLLYLHGGPTAHSSASFDPVLQYLAARGIAVFDLNYRGSSGFGKSFAALNDRRLRPNELGDIADAVAFLRDSGRVDADRAAVMGRSYGGYLTNAVVGAYPGLFKAGVSFVGVSDWVKAMEGAGPALKASDRLEYGDIDNPEDRAFMAGLSPINNAAKIVTPLVVEHGANDPRDPVTESDNLVEAVRRNGTEVTYLRFPDEGHAIVKRANQVHTWTTIAAFLEAKFGMGAASPASSRTD